MLSVALYVVAIVALLLFLIWASIYTISLSISLIRGAPYVATSRDAMKRIFNNLTLTKDTYFLELGCGDGRVIRTAAKEYGVKGKGIDINTLLLLKAKLLQKIQGLNTISFEKENLRTTDISKADIIYIFLFPKINEELKDKLLTETKKHVTIVSHAFKMTYLHEFHTKTIKGRKFNTYIYYLTHN